MLQSDALSDCRDNLGQIRAGYSISFSFLMFVYVFFHPYWSHECVTCLFNSIVSAQIKKNLDK